MNFHWSIELKMPREHLMTRSKRRLKLGLSVKEGEKKGIVAAQIREIEVKIMKEKLEKAEDDLAIAKKGAKHWKKIYLS